MLAVLGTIEKGKGKNGSTVRVIIIGLLTFVSLFVIYFAEKILGTACKLYSTVTSVKILVFVDYNNSE